jgi:ketosteroid isomerase-like protein
MLAIPAAAQSAAAAKVPESPLYIEIAAQDAAMFAAFNAHDLPGLMSFFSEDLEFYHDKDGLESYAKVNEGFARLFKMNMGLKRTLVPGTLRVYPIPGYGAMEIGQHRFCHFENGRDDCGTFDFSHIWQKKDDRWRVTRILSYGH